MIRFIFLLSFLCILDINAQKEPPNIIIIFTDDLGYGDLGCFGHPTIRTPNLDQMAGEGIRFTEFYVAASVCTPSRAGLLTGKYPVRTGLVKGKIPGDVLFPNSKTGLAPRETTIAEVVKQRNYATKAIGKWHLGHLPEYLPIKQGFDSYFGIPYSNDMDFVRGTDGEKGYWNVPLMRDSIIIERPANQSTLTKRYTEEAINFIEKNKSRPFFLYLAHTMPHIPLFASGSFEGTSSRGLYGDVIEEIDWSVGEILQTLKKNQLEKNTLVIFTSDNGPWLVQKLNGGSAGLLRDGKGTTWEGGMRVPMIAWWPGTVPSAMVSDELITSLDLLPSIATITKNKIPDSSINGIDQSELLLSGSGSKREFFAYYKGDKLFAARLGPWKAHYYTQEVYPDRPIVKHDPPLLYQLKNDPSEKYNLAVEYPGILKQISEKVREHLSSIEEMDVPNIEGESLIDKAKVTGGSLRIQDMSNFDGMWSGNQLWWVEGKPGDELSFTFNAADEGRYELIGFFTRARDYGIIRIKIDGTQVGYLMDGYSPAVEPTGDLNLGKVTLAEGEHILSIEIVGKDTRSGGFSEGYLVGIDGFLIRKL